MNKWVAALQLIGVGFFVGGSIVLGTGIGVWLDSKFNTGPFLVITGLIVGIMVAFFGVYQMLLPFLNNKRNKENL